MATTIFTRRKNNAFRLSCATKIMVGFERDTPTFGAVINCEIGTKHLKPHPKLKLGPVPSI